MSRNTHSKRLLSFQRSSVAITMSDTYIPSYNPTSYKVVPESEKISELKNETIDHIQHFIRKIKEAMNDNVDSDNPVEIQNYLKKTLPMDGYKSKTSEYKMEISRVKNADRDFELLHEILREIEENISKEQVKIEEKKIIEPPITPISKRTHEDNGLNKQRKKRKKKGKNGPQDKRLIKERETDTKEPEKPNVNPIAAPKDVQTKFSQPSKAINKGLNHIQKAPRAENRSPTSDVNIKLNSTRLQDVNEKSKLCPKPRSQSNGDDEIIEAIKKAYKDKPSHTYTNDPELNEKHNVINLPDVPLDYTIAINVEDNQEKNERPIETEEETINRIKNIMEKIRKDCKNTNEKIKNTKMDNVKIYRKYDEYFLKEIMKLDVLDNYNDDIKADKERFVKEIKDYMSNLEERFKSDSGAKESVEENNPKKEPDTTEKKDVGEDINTRDTNLQKEIEHPGEEINKNSEEHDDITKSEDAEHIESDEGNTENKNGVQIPSINEDENKSAVEDPDTGAPASNYDDEAKTGSDKLLDTNDAEKPVEPVQNKLDVGSDQSEGQVNTDPTAVNDHDAVNTDGDTHPKSEPNQFTETNLDTIKTLEKMSGDTPVIVEGFDKIDDNSGPGSNSNQDQPKNNQPNFTEDNQQKHIVESKDTEPYDSQTNETNVDGSGGITETKVTIPGSSEVVNVSITNTTEKNSVTGEKESLEGIKSDLVEQNTACLDKRIGEYGNDPEINEKFNEINLPDFSQDYKIPTNNEEDQEKSQPTSQIDLEKILDKIYKIDMDAKRIAVKMNNDPSIEKNGKLYKYYDEYFTQEMMKLDSIVNYTDSIRDEKRFTIKRIQEFVKDLESKATTPQEIEERIEENVHSEPPKEVEDAVSPEDKQEVDAEPTEQSSNSDSNPDSDNNEDGESADESGSNVINKESNEIEQVQESSDDPEEDIASKSVTDSAESLETLEVTPLVTERSNNGCCKQIRFALIFFLLGNITALSFVGFMLYLKISYPRYYHKF